MDGLAVASHITQYLKIIVIPVFAERKTGTQTVALDCDGSRIKPVGFSGMTGLGLWWFFYGR